MRLEMVKFSQKDADDLARVKEVMLTKALEGDAHAASAFATILVAQNELSINKELSKGDAGEVSNKVDPLEKWRRPAPQNDAHGIA
jgi:hypothetical protein